MENVFGAFGTTPSTLTPDKFVAAARSVVSSDPIIGLPDTSLSTPSVDNEIASTSKSPVL